MRQICLLSALFAQSVSAQFSELAVTDDGRLLISTRLARGSENPRSKVYLITSEGLQLLRAGEGSGPVGTEVVRPLTSGDGLITGFALDTPSPTSNSFCVPRGSLKSVEYQFQGISLGGVNTVTTGKFAVSRNGRYLVDASWNGRIIEIATKQIWQFPMLAGVAGYVANTGAVIIREAVTTAGSMKYVLPGAETRPISTPTARTIASSPPRPARTISKPRSTTTARCFT